MAREAASAILLVTGASFMLLAAVGLLRMPDIFTRMQTVAKAATMGVMCMFLAVALHFDELGITSRALAVVAFTFLTAPVAAHMIGRAAYFVGLPLWKGTIVNEMKDRYDPVTHELAGAPLQTAERAHRTPEEGRGP